MRNNLPVSNVEVVLRDDALIVSKTDLKGQITYINKDFLDISGFSEAELLGEPHNIVRHPDMPVEAFDDMWRTLKSGRPWVGYVKNRCKNGDFYWVAANAAPLVENGELVGYISVRRKASAATIQAHEELYKRFREKRQGSLKIRYGQATSWSGPRLNDMGIGAKLWAGIGAVVVIGAIAIGSSMLGMQGAKVSFNEFVDTDQRLLEAYSEMYAQGLQMGQALRNVIIEPANKKAYDNLAQARTEFQQQYESALGVAGSDEALRQSLGQINKRHLEHLAIQDAIIVSVKAGDSAAATQTLKDKDTPIWRDYKQLLLDGRKELRTKAVEGRSDVEKMVSSATRLSLLAGLISILVAGLIAWLLSRNIRRPMAEMNETFTNILGGVYSNTINVVRNDEIGKSLQELMVLQTRMGFEVAESRRQADETSRIKMALDCVGTPVRIADVDGKVIYMNGALSETLRRIEPQLRAQNPSFALASFVGSSIGNLYADPVAALQRLASLTQTVTTEMGIGGRTYRVVTSPVFGTQGDRLGSVGEWQDRTDELAVEREVSDIVSAASRGDFEQRLSLDGKEGFFKQLAEGMNRLSEVTSSGLLDVANVLSAVAQGDLTRNIDADYQGLFARLKDDTNGTIARLREVIGQIQDATDAINTAAKEISSGNQDLSSRTEEQASSLEETASSMEQLTGTVKQNADHAKEANELAGNAQVVAERAGAVVGQVVDTMSAIQQSSGKISDIIGVIDGIAFQTNILALNAAVEAARAGEQGRGFAVVATEVRSLAQRSAAAAREIKGLISDSVEKVETGHRQVDEAGRTMEEVVASIKGVARIMADIAEASREQSAGIEQIGLAVSQMDEVTQQNAALVEEAAAAAESLEEQAQSLTHSVSVFHLAGEKQVALAAPRSAAPAMPAADKSSRFTAQRSGQKPVPKLAASLDDEWHEF